MVALRSSPEPTAQLGASTLPATLKATAASDISIVFEKPTSATTLSASVASLGAVRRRIVAETWAALVR